MLLCLLRILFCLVNSDSWSAYNYFVSPGNIPGMNITWKSHQHNNPQNPHVDPTDPSNHSQKAEAINSKLKENVLRPLRGTSSTTIGSHIQAFEWQQNFCATDNTA